MSEKTETRDEIIARSASGVQAVEDALVGLTEADLDLVRAETKWTIRQIVHHIVDGDDLWKAVIKAALGSSRGLFSFLWYWDVPQDEWVERWDYTGRAIAPSLALLRANRRHVVQLLQGRADAWERYTLITLPNGEKRATSVGYVVEMQTNHLLSHIDDIRRIRQAHDL